MSHPRYADFAHPYQVIDHLEVRIERLEEIIRAYYNVEYELTEHLDLWADKIPVPRMTREAFTLLMDARRLRQEEVGY